MRTDYGGGNSEMPECLKGQLNCQIDCLIKFRIIYYHPVITMSLILLPDGDARVPRGYAFVTYSNYAVADEAIRKLNGQRIGGRQIRVQPATSDTTYNRPSSSSLPPGVPRSLSMSIKVTTLALQEWISKAEGCRKCNI